MAKALVLTDFPQHKTEELTGPIKEEEGWGDWFSDTKFLFYLIYGPWLQITFHCNNKNCVYTCTNVYTSDQIYEIYTYI